MLTATELAWREKRLAMIRTYEQTETRRCFIDEGAIDAVLQAAADPEPAAVRDVLAKAGELAGLSPDEAALLMNNRDPDLWEETFRTANRIKQEVYGNRIVLFAPLYISSPCVNNCAYCGFRHTNDKVVGRTLSMSELDDEVRVLTGKGHKRLIVVYGEHPDSDVDFMCRTIERIYAYKNGRDEIRRVNVNAAPLSVEEYRQVHAVGIGTYQIFQETYHPATYRRMHPADTLKGSYLWRLFSLHRAQEAGVDDVAIGALFGLYDWRFEVLGLLYHALDLEREFGVGPHTISFPRLEPALNTPLGSRAPAPVSDEDFKKAVAVLRCAVPYTGMILTCRERPALRRRLIPLGVSQIDAGSRTAVGGYKEMEREHIPDREQFQLGDTRSLDDTIRELCADGYIPSFCTAGYRAGRTGCQFMSLAKKGQVKNFCIPNAALTFKEYLMDYASPETRAVGEETIRRYAAEYTARMPERGAKLGVLLGRMDGGERDLYF